MMIIFEKALEIVLSHARCKGTERVPLHRASGRILAQDVFADIDMPPFHKSAVDGFAYCEADFNFNSSSGQTLRIIDTIPAGAISDVTITKGTCARIMTGAMVPAGAHGVVMVEDTNMAGENLIRFTLKPGSLNICYKGEDIREGEKLLDQGTRISPAHVAVMASVGIHEPPVYQQPSVAIISTGDELTEPDSKPGPGKIRNSNAYQLFAQASIITSHVGYMGIAPDEPTQLLQMISEAIEHHDVVLLTGGVSMGDFDFVPAMMKQAGLDIFFEKIAVQPGKPTIFAGKEEKFVFGLPGNPVSSFVLFELMVKPFLYKLMGHQESSLYVEVQMGSAWSRKKTDRKAFIPVTLAGGKAFPVTYHGSAHINAYTLADAILGIEIGQRDIAAGELVHVRLL